MEYEGNSSAKFTEEKWSLHIFELQKIEQGNLAGFLFMHAKKHYFVSSDEYEISYWMYVSRPQCFLGFNGCVAELPSLFVHYYLIRND